MKKEKQLFTIGFISICIVDIIGSIASNKLHFNYVYITPISLCIYSLIGYLVSKAKDRKTALLISGILGWVDGTLGWFISIKLNAYTGMGDYELTVPMVAIGAIFTAGLAVLFGFLGSLLNKKSNNDSVTKQ